MILYSVESDFNFVYCIDFSLTEWMESNEITNRDYLSEYSIHKVLDDLRITEYLNDKECSRYLPSDDNGWNISLCMFII